MSSGYVAEPGFENHSLGLPGMITMKAGICAGEKDGQAYVNRRYGQSKLHWYIYKEEISFEQMKLIEKQVLQDLVSIHGYKKQHGKREHFIIPYTRKDIQVFVRRVIDLYSVYTD
jgi:hypothetical protein